MKSLMLYIGTLILLSSCHPHPFRPAMGDLLFQINDSTAMTSAITSTTAINAPLPYSHVAIALGPSPSGADSVIEATSEGSVRIVALEDFIRSSAHMGSGGYGCVVMRLRDTTSIAHRATHNARQYLGQPYDYSYRPANGKMYCSELVWESYLTPTGAHLFGARPMNFRDSHGNLPSFWIELFEQLGEEIPEGIPGTNPADLSRDTLLREVHRYF